MSQCMSLHALKILRFRGLSLVLSVSVVVPLTVFLGRCTLTVAQDSSLCHYSPHRHTHVSCVC